MSKRFVSIWFRFLTTEWVARQQPMLKDVPFVLASQERGRKVVKGVNAIAYMRGITTGMVVADAKAVFPTLEVLDDIPGLEDRLLNGFAAWCIRYTPIVAVDPPDGLILDISGCAHLWGGEYDYLKEIITKLRGYGYHVRAAIADTIGTAWAVARYGRIKAIIEPGKQIEALLPLLPVALRLETATAERMHKLGLYQIRNFIDMPRSVLRRRFGTLLLTRIDQALGYETEAIMPIQPAAPYQERLPCLEPIRSRPGVEIALRKLLDVLCERLVREGKGLRTCVFKGYRIDGNIQQIAIGTSHASRNAPHVFRLFEIKLTMLEPDLGFELFTLEAPSVEDVTIEQDSFWNEKSEGDDIMIAELLDRLAGKVGAQAIHRYLPDEHYWPENAFKEAASFQEQPTTTWPEQLSRPLHMLPTPELIKVAVQLPDYPPMLFHYKGTLHRIKKADGPERVEQEWWLRQGEYRDYYCVEDEAGARYWLFRAGPYEHGEPEWFIHGFFA